MSAPDDHAAPLTLGAKATLACVWEATAPKPGNVYRGADFADMTYADFLASATAIGPEFDHASDGTLGELVLRAVRATRRVVAVNTNLGTLLLLAPLAIAADADLRRGASDAVRASTIDDARSVYEAIRLASPGGMGRADQADIADTPEITLLEAMRLAEGRDLIARQYATGFEDVFASADAIAERTDRDAPLSEAIVWAQLELMQRRPDTLIARKCGRAVADESADRAAMAIDSVASDGNDLRAACAELDFWLRADGNRRNPGATADAIAAALFVLLIEERIRFPVDFYGRRNPNR